MEIQELIKRRQTFVDAQEKNGFDLTTVLVGLYSDVSHFVYELLQNAEDAHASAIEFELFPDKLVVTHNGKSFTEDDIEAITGISNIQNEKKTDLEKIGKFGIGFKSVYSITNSPHIQSGSYDFKVVKFILPAEFSTGHKYGSTTFTLPFNHPKYPAKSAYESIRKKFETFECFNLLFLNHLHSISLKWEQITRKFSKDENKVKGDLPVYHTSIRTESDAHHYLLVKGEVKHEAFSSLKNKPPVAIAFKTSNEKPFVELVRADSSHLFVFFETQYESFLNFMLQAPFTTTPARDNIDFQLPVNMALLNELASLLHPALEYFRKNKIITIDLLGLLPIDNSIESGKLAYRTFFNTTKEILSSDDRYLPTMFKQQYQSAKDVAIVRGRELTSLLSNVSDMQLLWGRKYWMDPQITVDRTPELLSYLTKVLGIPEFTPEDFARKLSREFLQSKPDKWFQRFYEFLNGRQESLWRKGRVKDEGILRKRPIMRLSDGTLSEPFDEKDNPAVFLPVKDRPATYKTVSGQTIQSKASLEFVKEKLGIRQPDEFDEIKQQIIPLYTNKKSKELPSKEENIKHWEVVLNIYEGLSDTRKSELVNLVKDTNVLFFNGINAKDGSESYQNYQYLYLPTEYLKQYFRYSDNIFFLEPELFPTIEFEKLSEFAKKCGVKDHVWMIEFDPEFSSSRKAEIRKANNKGDDRNSYWDKENIIDIRLEGLQEILTTKNYNVEVSQLVWTIVIDAIKNETRYNELFRGRYNWFYYSSHTGFFESETILQLKNTKWLFKQGSDEKFRPDELLLSELAVGYIFENEEAKRLIDQLRFKVPAEQTLLEQMPPDKQEKFRQFEELQRLCHEKGIDIEEAFNELSSKVNREDEQKQLDNAPAVEDVDIQAGYFEEFDDSNVKQGVKGSDIASEKMDEEASDSNGETDERNKDNNSSTQKSISPEMREEIGLRGEKIVMRHLKKQWLRTKELISESEYEMLFKDENGEEVKIIHLNEEGKKGIGCDILIKTGDRAIKYIEVKSTRSDDKELYSVTGYQWSLANKLYKEGNGDIYYFYVVKNVFDEKPVVTPIKNPIKKWIAGTLRAHPVNFEL